MSLEIRPLRAEDVPTLLELIDRLAEYEKLDGPDADARQRLAQDAMTDPPRFRTFLAEVDGKAVGYAIYFYTYSTFLARPTLYLEDIFVLPEQRGQGAGIGLFRACVNEAVATGCGRMEWQVLTWNTPTIEFYERLGARRMDAWYSYRLDDEALARIATTAAAGIPHSGVRGTPGY